jgi:hypothetical protein
MKKTILSLALVLAFISCSEKKVAKDQKAEAQIEKHSKIDLQKIAINWTAYKTTEKKAVKGKFTEFSLSAKRRATIQEVLDGASLEIMVASISSGNEDRDKKLKENFFGVMKDTEVLKGVLKIKDATSGVVAFTMNSITFNLPVTLNNSDNKFTILGTMNLDNWKTQAAITALNVACKDKHKGADGISKTWSEVNIEVVIPYTKK